MLLFSALHLGVACQVDGDMESVDSAQVEGVIDLRVDYPDPPEGGLQVLTPDLEIAPYDEKLFCYFGTWDGPDVGITQYIPLHPNEFHHHSLLKDVSELGEVEDGTLLTCGEGEGDVPTVNSPLVHAIPMVPPMGLGNTLNLPEGFAVKLPSGQRWSADVHFINPTPTPLRVNVAFNLALIPLEEVQYWVGSFDHDAGFLELPPGEETTVSFDCPLLAGTKLLSVLAHMHGFGERYLIELVRADGETIELLRVDQWDPNYRFAQPSRGFSVFDYPIEEGDQLRTHCTWFNSTDEVLGYPLEMCTTSGALLGMESTQYCTGTLVEDGS